jgi:hypothetical protein
MCAGQIVLLKFQVIVLFILPGYFFPKFGIFYEKISTTESNVAKFNLRGSTICQSTLRQCLISNKMGTMKSEA